MHFTYEQLSMLGWGLSSQPDKAGIGELQTGAMLRIATAAEKIEEHLRFMSASARDASRMAEEAKQKRWREDEKAAAQWVSQFAWPKGPCRRRVTWAAEEVLGRGVELTVDSVLEALPSVRNAGKKTLVDAERIMRSCQQVAST